MKQYEKYRNEALDELKREYMKNKRLVYARWEAFAITGKCDDISCGDCPFGIGNCGSSTSRISRLNEEVQENAGMGKEQG